MANESKKTAEIPLPEGHEDRPFVLAFVEKAAVDKLRPSNMTFSEALSGLQARELAESESFESTQGSTEGADTTITF